MSTDTTTRTPSDLETPKAPRTSGQAVWPVVMMREIVVKLRDRNFVVGTLITLVLIAGGLGLNIVLSGKSDEVTVVVTGDGARAVMEQVGQVAEQRDVDMKLTVTEVPDAAAVEAAVRDETADVGLIHSADGWRLVGRTELKPTMSAYVSEVVGDRTLAANAQTAGTTAATLTAGGTVTPQLLAPDSNEGFKLAVGLIFSFLFYFASIMFGMTIATSVVEEKQSRVVEILVSAVPLRQLLAGKVLGNVLLALGQMVLFVGVGLIGMAFTSYAAQLGARRGLGRLVPRLLPRRVRRTGLPLGGRRFAGDAQRGPPVDDPCPHHDPHGRDVRRDLRRGRRPRGRVLRAGRVGDLDAAAAARRRGGVVGAVPVASRDARVRGVDHGGRRASLPAVDHAHRRSTERSRGPPGRPLTRPRRP